MFLYVCKQTFRKLYEYITREFLGLRMLNFQGIIFMWTRTYSEIFKSAWVYLKNMHKVIYPHKRRSFTCVSAYSPRQEFRLETWWCRWNFKENNKKSCSFTIKRRSYFVSRISVNMRRPWSWMWGSFSRHGFDIQRWEQGHCTIDRCRKCFQFG